MFEKVYYNLHCTLYLSRAETGYKVTAYKVNSAVTSLYQSPGTRGYLVTRIKHKFSENGWAELKFLSANIIPHLSSLKFGTVGLDRLCIG